MVKAWRKEICEMFPHQVLPWGNRFKLLASYSGRINIVSKVFLPAFWVLLFITPVSLLFFSFHFLWAEPTAWKKSALERKTANYIQMLETGMVIISSRGVRNPLFCYWREGSEKKQEDWVCTQESQATGLSPSVKKGRHLLAMEEAGWRKRLED